MLGVVQEAKHKVRKLSAELKGRAIVESRHQNWDNTSYCKSFSVDSPHQYGLSEFFEVMADNLGPLADEYCLGKRVVEYPLKLRNDGGTSGVGAGYKERLTAQAQRFGEKMRSVSKNRQRAEIETLDSARLEHWQARVLFDPEVQVGTKLAWFSPPGFRFEGYHGVGKYHHSFIWVYEKKLDGDGTTKVTMTQLKCYPNLDQLSQVQAKLRALQTLSSPGPNDGLNLLTLTSRNRVIAEMIELPSTVSMTEIEQYIYESEINWPVQREELPQLCEQQLEDFQQELSHVLEEFLIPMYREVLCNLHNPRAWSLVDYPHLEHKLQSPLRGPFWSSPEYKNMIRRLDDVFGLAYQALLKWVEDSAAGKAVGPIPIDELRNLYDILQSIHAGTATKDDKKAFNKSAPLLLSAGSRILSIGQCGIGTLIPRHLLDKMDLFKANRLGDITPEHLQKLSASEKISFKKSVMDEYRLLSLAGKDGSFQKFWVLKDKYPEYDGKCYQDATGEWLGPCDISLSTGADEFVTTDFEYQQRLAALNSPPAKNTALHKVSTLEQLTLSQETNSFEKAALQLRFAKLKKVLKPNLSITELINEDYIQPAMKLVAIMEDSQFLDLNNPLQGLTELERALTT